MNLGFLGIQVATGLQISNASAIFESLGASTGQIPALWLGAPVAGLIVQPIVGNLSDKTWNRFGHRQPYFLGGAIFAAIALILMVQAAHLWIAVTLYWGLQIALNISIAPARPFVGDLLPPEQRTLGYSVQSFCIGLGTIAASALPWCLNWVFPVSEASGIPQAIRLAYYIGAGICLSATLWTFFTVQEPNPDDDDTPQPTLIESLRFIAQSAVHMPLMMRKLGWSQFFTWLGIYSIFLYFPTAVAFDVLGAPDRHSLAYAHGVEWAGICIAFYNFVCLIASGLLPIVSRLWGRVLTHAVSLLCGAIGLISLLSIHSRYPLLLAMIGIGIAWASALSIPYALLFEDLPEGQSGVYMGLFNAFVVFPQIVMSLGLGWLINSVLGCDRIVSLALGGGCLGIAALLMLRVPEASAEGSKQVADGQTS